VTGGGGPHGRAAQRLRHAPSPGTWGMCTQATPIADALEHCKEAAAAAATITVCARQAPLPGGGSRGAATAAKHLLHFSRKRMHHNRLMPAYTGAHTHTTAASRLAHRHNQCIQALLLLLLRRRRLAVLAVAAVVLKAVFAVLLRAAAASAARPGRGQGRPRGALLVLLGAGRRRQQRLDRNLEVPRWGGVQAHHCGSSSGCGSDSGRRRRQSAAGVGAGRRPVPGGGGGRYAHGRPRTGKGCVS
jgi:hypothetical protein